MWHGGKDNDFYWAVSWSLFLFFLQHAHTHTQTLNTTTPFYRVDVACFSLEGVRHQCKQGRTDRCISSLDCTSLSAWILLHSSFIKLPLDIFTDLFMLLMKLNIRQVVTRPSGIWALNCAKTKLSSGHVWLLGSRCSLLSILLLLSMWRNLLLAPSENGSEVLLQICNFPARGNVPITMRSPDDGKARSCCVFLLILEMHSWHLFTFPSSLN